MKTRITLTLFLSAVLFLNCKSEKPDSLSSKNSSGSVVVELTTATFKKMVYNFDLNKEWKFEGDKPAIIDFYADWCGPCRQLSPLVEEVAKEFEGKIVVYKINTDNENALAQSLGIKGLPTLLFIPVKGSPRASIGLIPKESLIKAVNEVLLIK